jgi:hypothetical protein
MTEASTMTGDTKHRTLKDQLEAEIADMERHVEEDPDHCHGGDWLQLSDEEEAVFAIRRDRFPRMIMTWHCYDDFKTTSAATFDNELVEQARQQHPEWCDTPMSDEEFADFAKTLGGLMQREAYAIYAKHDFWCTRHGITVYADGS